MKHTNIPPPRKHGVRYPWREWFNAGSVTIKQGKDFEAEPHGMAQTARQAAARLGYTISVAIHGSSLTITVVI
jgi:hypothetical protein